MAELSANTLRYVDYGLARHTRYWYRLTAHNSQGSSDPQAVQAETAAEPVSIGEDWVEGEIAQTVIDYQYDALYRLTQANYSDGTFFHYAYDSNGNRVSETTEAGTVESLYDAANRLTSVGATSYTWDANGNLTSDGGRTYSYNAANRLTGVTQNGQTVNYRYNGLGDRLVEGTTQFEMDLNAGLTQVLSDGANTYLYGNGRIGQFAGVESAYFLGDALGSVRQLVDGSGAVTLAQSYEPYGEVMGSSGSGETAYAYTGEWHSSSTNLLYLRSRYYIAETGRFLTKDTWQGDFTLPLTLNGWNYVEGNPVNFVDPTGHSRYIAYFAEFVDSYDKNNKDAPHWTQKEMMVVNSVMVKIAMAYKRAYDEMAIRKYTQWFNNKCYYLDDPINFIEPSKIDPATAFFKVHGGRVILERVTGNNGNAWGMAQTARKVYIYKKATEEKFIDPQHEPFIAHEMGHVFENAFEEIYKRTEKGAGYKPGRDLVAKSGEGDLNNRKGFGGGFLKWQFSDEISSWEIFADMYVGWLYNSWASKPTAVPESSLYNIQSSNFQAGVNKAKFMDQHMPEWVYYIISNRR